MICGAYALAGRPARDLEPFDRLRRAGGQAGLLVDGPLAVAAGGPEAHTGQAGDLICVLDGFLHAPARLAAELGAESEDPAVLVAQAYRRHGPDALGRLRGRFSLVLWDRSRQEGLLGTDPLATRQQFTRTAAGGVLFAGELRDLLGLLPVRPGPDPAAFPAWLMSGICPEGLTLYEGVGRLGPGEMLALAPDSPERRPYWRPRYAGTMRGGRAELVDGLREKILDGAARRLPAGGTGVILSGGLDSSLVTAAVHAAGARMRTYSAVFPGASYDESDKIRELTDRLGIERRTLQIRPQGTLWQALHYAARWQVPLAGMGAIVDLAATAEAGRDRVAVLMDGQTGDEVLGFAPYLVADRLRRGRARDALRLIDRWPGNPPRKRHQKLWLLREVGIKGAAPHRLGQVVRVARADSAERSPWLLEHLRARQAELEDRWAWKVRHDGPLWWRHLADVLVYGPHREQRMDYLRHRAAAAELVGESPLYDMDLIQYCLSLPPELAFDPRYDRALAREAAVGLLPEPVRLQPRKADFGPFVHAAVTRADAAGIERLLTAPDAELGGYVDREWVVRNWRRLRASRFGEQPGLSTLWRLASAECWLRLQSDPGFAERMLADPEVPGVATDSVDLAAVP